MLLLLVFHFFLNTSQEIAWEEHPRNDLFYVKWDIKHLLIQLLNQSMYKFSVLILIYLLIFSQHTRFLTVFT